MRDLSSTAIRNEEAEMSSRGERVVEGEAREEEQHNGRARTDLIRLRRPVRELNERGTHIDNNYVAPHFYDCFNYSLLTGASADVNVAVGITSANAREGRTLVACNLAVSLTIAHQRKTVLVDLSMREPRLHSIFGVPANPGVLDGMGGGAIQVSPTQVNGLFVLSAGSATGRFAGLTGPSSGKDGSQAVPPETSLQLEQVAVFRDVVYSLKERFDFVIVDLPAVNDHVLPLLFANQLDGSLLVVRGGKTKQAEVDRALQMLNEHRVLGMVYNGVDRGPVRSART
jgi:Mrp family chromosome partitioning ATPase